MNHIDRYAEFEWRNNVPVPNGSLLEDIRNIELRARERALHRARLEKRVRKARDRNRYNPMAAMETLNNVGLLVIVVTFCAFAVGAV